MARYFARIVALSFLILPIGTMLTAGVPAADAATCHFVLGFKTLHGMAPATIGACLGNEQHNPTNGDAFQPTKKGTLVWRKSDNQIAFTDGYFTILDGPQGLERRLNMQRFPWEANPDVLPLAADSRFVVQHPRRVKTVRSTPTPAACPATAPKKAHRSAKKLSKKAVTSRRRC